MAEFGTLNGLVPRYFSEKKFSDA